MSIFLSMSGFTQWLLLASLKAAIVAVIIFIVQIVFRDKIPARWAHALWFVFIIRLFLPLELPSPASVFNMFAQQEAQPFVEESLILPTLELPKEAVEIDYPVPSAEMSHAAKPVPENSVQAISPVQIFSIFWFAGVLFFLGFTLWSNRSVLRSLRHQEPVEDEALIKLLQRAQKQYGIRAQIGLFHSNEIKTPFLFGYRRPRICIPTDLLYKLGKVELEHILLHELAHYKRKDTWTAFIVAVLQILHWFNPVVWMAFFKMRLDCEVACDELALVQLGRNNTNPILYGQTIIQILEHRLRENYLPLPTGLADSKSGIKNRMRRIAAFKKKSMWWSLAAVILFGALMILLLTEAKHLGYSEARDQVRSLFFLRDFEQGQIYGEKHLKHYPDSLELKAWTLLNALENEYYLYDRIFSQARDMIKNNPSSPWGYFVLAHAHEVTAFARHRGSRIEALESSERALSLMPDHPDLLWMYARMLQFNTKYEEALTFIEKNIPRVKNYSELMVQQANIYKHQAGLDGEKVKDEEKWNRAKAAYTLALGADSTCVNALYERSRNNSVENIRVLLEKALEISPWSNQLRMQYWSDILSDRVLNFNDRKQLIEEDFDKLLKERGHYPNALMAVYWTCLGDELDDTTRTEQVEKTILKKFPNSPAAEWVLILQNRRFVRQADSLLMTDEATKKQYYRLLNDYIGRSEHHLICLWTEAVEDLYNLSARDTTVNDEELLQTIYKFLELPAYYVERTYPDISLKLTDRFGRYTDAEKVARKGIKTALDCQEPLRPKDMNDKDWEKQLGWQLNTHYDALGWALFRKGDLENGAKYLHYANELSDRNRYNYFHLGQYYEQLKDYEKAKSYYALGKKIDRPGENPNENALEQLEVLLGERVTEKTGAERTGERKRDILDTRLDRPQSLTSFSMETYNGPSITSRDLKGKIGVINFWGIWCGWCVRELPEYQELYEKYRDDKEVVILSVNNDNNPNKIEPFMTKHGYSFPVLLDNNYVKKVDIQGFPTTWFVNKNGKIEFFQKGYTGHLVEEFSWRIEAMRGQG
ncbi:redoxin domain-containing protein [candidate division KSB1 bacterium]|nr:redoxin domain-containing protein [candidate division KSB1 bacterium]